MLLWADLLRLDYQAAHKDCWYWLIHEKKKLKLRGLLMTQSPLRLWYKPILKCHNLWETVMLIHLDYVLSLSTRNLSFLVFSFQLQSEGWGQGWDLDRVMLKRARDGRWATCCIIQIDDLQYKTRVCSCGPATGPGESRAGRGRWRGGGVGCGGVGAPHSSSTVLALLRAICNFIGTSCFSFFLINLLHCCFSPSMC